ncbi:MAG: nucleoside permease [Enterobacteriaceae bacterium]
MGIQNRLKIMLFLQFFIWGSWLVTLGTYMFQKLNFSGTHIGTVYGSLGLASIIMPSLIGIIADRWIPANRLFIYCHILSAITLVIATTVTTPLGMFVIILLNSMFYMPTIALSNTISYYSLEKEGFTCVTDFPPVRVWGTVGFIAAMWLVNLIRLEAHHAQLYVSAISTVVLVLYSFSLPFCPTSHKQKGQSWIEMMGLDALVLFKRKQMAIFLIFAMFLGAALQITNMFGNPFLQDFAAIPQYADSLAVRFPNILLSLSQISEVLFILTIPFFLRRFGIKIVMLISMLAWSLRFVFFAYGDPTAFGMVLLILSMIVYGCAFDFFNISGAIFMEQEVEPRIRASAQGLFMTMVNGVGAFAGAKLSGMIVDIYTVDGVKNWQSIWLIFGVYSFVLAVVFLFIFQYKHDPNKLETHKAS